MPRLDSERRYKDIYDRLSEPSIVEDPAPVEVGIELLRLLTEADTLTLSDSIEYTTRL